MVSATDVQTLEGERMQSSGQFVRAAPGHRPGIGMHQHPGSGQVGQIVEQRSPAAVVEQNG